jgi:hypothetical protein
VTDYSIPESGDWLEKQKQPQNTQIVGILGLESLEFATFVAAFLFQSQKQTPAGGEKI